MSNFKTSIKANKMFKTFNILFPFIQVHLFIAVDDPEEVDNLSMNLPIMKELGNMVHITCRSVQHLDEYLSRVMTEIL